MDVTSTLYFYLFLWAVLTAMSSWIPNRYFCNHPGNPWRQVSCYYILSAMPVIIYTIVWGLRDGVGTDYDRYVYKFYDSDSIIENGTSLELVYMYMCSILKSLNYESTSIFIVTSFLNILPIFIVGRRWNSILLSATVSFFLLTSCFFAQNGVRQALALSFMIVAIMHLSEDGHGLWKFGIFSFLAVFSHVSSIIFIITIISIYYCKQIRFNPTILVIVYILLEVIGQYLQYTIFDNSIWLVYMLGYEDLISDTAKELGKGAEYSSGLGIPLRIALNIIVIYAYSKIRKGSSKDFIYYAFLIYIIGMLLGRLFVGSLFLTRVATSFTYLGFFAIAFSYYILLTSKKPQEKLMAFALYGGFILKYVISIFNNANGVVPYKMIEHYI